MYAAISEWPNKTAKMFALVRICVNAFSPYVGCYALPEPAGVPSWRDVLRRSNERIAKG